MLNLKARAKIGIETFVGETGMYVKNGKETMNKSEQGDPKSSVDNEVLNKRRFITLHSSADVTMYLSYSM